MAVERGVRSKHRIRSAKSPRRQKGRNRPFQGFFNPLFYTKFAFCIKIGVKKERGQPPSFIIFPISAFVKPFWKNKRSFKIERYVAVGNVAHAGYVAPWLSVPCPYGHGNGKRKAVAQRATARIFALLDKPYLVWYSLQNWKGVISCLQKFTVYLMSMVSKSLIH